MVSTSAKMAALSTFRQRSRPVRRTREQAIEPEQIGIEPHEAELGKNGG